MILCPVYEHLEPLLVGVFLVYSKEGWPVVPCMLFVWHLGTTTALSVLRLDFSVYTICLEGSSERKTVVGASGCVHLHMCEMHAAPTEN